MRILYFQKLQIRKAKFLDINVMEFSKMTCKQCLQVTETLKVQDITSKEHLTLACDCAFLIFQLIVFQTEQTLDQASDP